MDTQLFAVNRDVREPLKIRVADYRLAGWYSIQMDVLPAGVDCFVCGGQQL